MVYDKEKAAQPDEVVTEKPKKLISFGKKGSIIMFGGKVDSRGSISSKRYHYGGYWASQRVANLLPFEYKPQ